MGQGLVHDHTEFLEVEGFVEVVEGPTAHGLDGRGYGGVGRHHDHFRARRHVAYAAQYLQAIDARQPDVDDCNIGAGFLGEPHPFLAGRGHSGGIAMALQVGGNSLRQNGFIFDDKDEGRHRSCLYKGGKCGPEAGAFARTAPDRHSAAMGFGEFLRDG